MTVDRCSTEVSVTLRVGLALLMASLLPAFPVRGQELEPRRWSHLPVGSNFLGSGYVYTTGDIAFEPVLQIQQGEVELHTFAAKFIHSFECLGKSARFDLVQAYQDGTWSGLLQGVPASAKRSGWSDTALRFAVNLSGAPPLAGKEFAEYRASVADRETIVGAGLVMVLPTGEYFDDKLINLGDNRVSFRPQAGIIHSRGPWMVEFTGSAWLYTDNEDFWNGHRLEQDPLFLTQFHLIHTFRPGLWLGASLGYDSGGSTTVNGAANDDQRSQLSWALTCGLPLSRTLGLKLGYIGSRTLADTGADPDCIVFGLSVMW